MQKLETEPKAGQGDWTICRICLNKCVTLDLNEDMNDSKHSVNLPLNNTNKNKYYSLFQTLPDSNTPTSFHHMIMAISSVRVIYFFFKYTVY